MLTIESLRALEILDSRGRPTVRTTCRLKSGAVGSASVPSGASTGAAEVLELRDGDANRYGGLGCRQAVENVNRALNDALRGKAFESQEQLDRAMIKLDGMANKSRLGANAILSVSLAFARACAVERGEELFRYFSSCSAKPQLARLPRLTVNLFSGGKHAGGQVPIQDVLVIPTLAKTIDESLAHVYAVYQSAAKMCAEKYQMRALTADEGGLAPPFPSVEAMLDDAVESIRRAGFVPGRDVHLAVDVASSHFYRDGFYELGRLTSASSVEPRLRGSEMIEQLDSWIDKYPILSLEDGLAEDDWEHWPALRKTIGDRALVLGDDFLCTNPARIRRAIDTNSANALLLKVNQIGTLTEAAEAFALAKDAGWSITVSARSGETEDDWLADLAAGWAADQVKVGSITQSERLAKYNRLLEIESEARLPIAPWPCRATRDDG
jgi:enolase